MTLFLVSIPLMVLAVAIGIGPLAFQHFRDGKASDQSDQHHVDKTLADLDSLPVSPATRERAKKVLTANKG